MSKTILKPCPFCGTEAELREHWGDCYRGPSWYEVECKNLDCGRCQDSPDEAVIAWNKRSFADYEALEANRSRLVGVAEESLKWLDDVCLESQSYATEEGVAFYKKFKAAIDAAKGEAMIGERDYKYNERRVFGLDSRRKTGYFSSGSAVAFTIGVFALVAFAIGFALGRWVV